jgi:hypothetical protein
MVVKKTKKYLGGGKRTKNNTKKNLVVKNKQHYLTKIKKNKLSKNKYNKRQKGGKKEVNYNSTNFTKGKLYNENYQNTKHTAYDCETHFDNNKNNKAKQKKINECYDNLNEYLRYQSNINLYQDLPILQTMQANYNNNDNITNKKARYIRHGSNIYPLPQSTYTHSPYEKMNNVIPPFINTNPNPYVLYNPKSTTLTRK